MKRLITGAVGQLGESLAAGGANFEKTSRRGES